MRKSAITAVLCLSILTTGCGRMEPVVDSSEGAETTVAVGNNTEKTTDKNEKESPSTTAEPNATTASTKSDKKSTTTTASVVVHGGGTTLTVPKRTTAVGGGNTTTKRTDVTTAQTSTSTTAVTTVTTSVTPEHCVFTKDDIVCRVTGQGVEVSVGDDKNQTIEIDTEELRAALADIKTEMRARVVIDDIDLDGHDDLFIPQQVGMLNTFGVYYHYDSDKEEFVKWKELEEIDTCAEASRDDQTFTTELKRSEDEYEIKVFGWENGKPELRSMKKHYKSTDNKDEVLIDYFEYSNGEEQLVKRERVLFDAEGREVGAEEIELG